MSMIEDFTSVGGDTVKKFTNKFHYGHHPSIVMWSKGVAPQKEEESDLFGGLANQLEDILTTGSSEPELFNSFKFDAMVSEDHDANTIVTKFPVSSGFLVSDHVINQNRQLKLTAIASNMQNSAMWSVSLQGLSVITGAIFNNPIIPIVGGIAGTVASAFETEDRIQSTYNLFNAFRVQGTKLYISTILGPYVNCVVTGLRTRHDKMTSSILAIEITLEELQVIDGDDLADEARWAIESMYDYSEFAKIAQSLAIGVAGGMPLPGLGSKGSEPTSQLAELKERLDKLSQPLSSVKGGLL